MGNEKVKPMPSKLGEIKSSGMGYLFRQILNEKRISAKRFCSDLKASEFNCNISESSMYKILEDKVNFRADYIYMFLKVAGADNEDFIEKLKSLTEKSMETGNLYTKRTYYPRKK